MRLIRLTTAYPDYIAQLYGRHADLAVRSYAEQYSEIVEDAFGWADFWTVALSPLGYEVSELIGNAEQLQKTWARENGVPFADNRWMYDIALAQVRAFRPDILFIDDYAAFDAAFVHGLRGALPSLRLVLGWCAAPYYDSAVFSQYDVVLTSIPGAADHFRSNGLHAEVIGHAFDPRVLSRIDTCRPKQFAFTFIGTVRPDAAHLLTRQALLRQLMREGGLTLFADMSLPAPPPRTLSTLLRAALKGKLSAEDEDIRGWRTLAPQVAPARYGLEMFQTLRDSRLTFNAHSSFYGEWASNMRLYEATGVGTCLLTEWKQNLAALFEPDKEVAVYRNPSECVEKARWLLERQEEREAIAKAGQQRTLRDHTFERRAQALDAVIQRYSRRAA